MKILSLKATDSSSTTFAQDLEKSFDYKIKVTDAIVEKSIKFQNLQLGHFSSLEQNLVFLLFGQK